MNYYSNLPTKSTPNLNSKDITRSKSVSNEDDSEEDYSEDDF
jgi:hypothetical protein